MADILYHYCSTDALHAIMSTGKIRLSSMKLSNDHKEGQWIIDAVKRKYASGIPTPEISLILKYLTKCATDFSAMAFCLSEIPDLLSQWRGYADDGHGFCLGFSKAVLEKVCSDSFLDLSEITYMSINDEIVIDEYISNILNLVRDIDILLYLTEDEALNFFSSMETTYIDQLDDAREDIIEAFSTATDNFFKYKSPSFKEEKEWRIIYSDYGLNNLSFRPSRNRIIPYKEINIKKYRDIFSEIFIGPRNITPENVLADMVSSYGFSRPKIVRSSSTYR